jgi:hypothetical protein
MERCRIRGEIVLKFALKGREEEVRKRKYILREKKRRRTQ